METDHIYYEWGGGGWTTFAPEDSRKVPVHPSGNADSGLGSEVCRLREVKGVERKGVDCFVAMQRMKLKQCLYCRNSGVNIRRAAWEACSATWNGVPAEHFL
jgi:hypothetical protein